MDVKEMHIGIDIHLQKIDSEAFDNLLAEEKDWYLNSTVKRFIKNRSSSLSNLKRLGFQESQKRYDDLEKLITPASISLYKGTESGFVFGILPEDYFSLVNSSSISDFNQCNSIGIVDGDDVEVKYFCIPMTQFVPYNSFSITAVLLGIAGTTEPLFDSTSSAYPNLTTADQRHILVNQLLEQINQLDRWEARYENYGSLYIKDNLILIDKEFGTGDPTQWDYIETIHVNPATDETTTTQYTYKTLTFPTLKVGVGSTSKSSKRSQNRLINQEHLYRMIAHPFGKSTYSSPISILKNGQIEIAYDDNFLPSKLHIDYIRRPRMIDIKANQSCELAESVHEEIIDLAVQRIKAEISENNYQAILNENQLKE